MFWDKDADNGNSSQDLIYFKLSYQYGVNTVTNRNWPVYSRRWEKARLTSSEEWRIYAALRDGEAHAQLRRLGYTFFLPRKQIKTLDNRPIFSSPALMELLWRYERPTRTR